MTRNVLSLLALSTAAFGLSACHEDSSSKSTNAPAMSMSKEQTAEETVRQFKAADPGIQKFFDSSAGYAVFSKVSQGGAGIGAWAGDGVVFERGAAIGYSSLGGASIGAQIGGQTFSEIIFFKDKADLEIFKRSNTEFDAKASAVAAKTGAAAKNDYSRGVAIFITNQKGLMLEAAIGGQKFKYWPK